MIDLFGTGFGKLPVGLNGEGGAGGLGFPVVPAQSLDELRLERSVTQFFADRADEFVAMGVLAHIEGHVSFVC
ncbi:hypothetical protein [Ralstonia holmesii]|uniref:hypothetical protein n=1 Tax=Ralstonia holmesii TaxID=3058602 RepID=UPI00292FF6D4|nr:hypothetical protein [Ralstonia sp. LMG 32967]